MFKIKNTSKNDILCFLQDIKPVFKKKGIDKLGLFGSFAKDEANIYSDIDIAIQKEQNFLDKYGAYDYFDIINELKLVIKKRFSKNVDVFDIDSTSPFKEEIKKELIYV